MQEDSEAEELQLSNQMRQRYVACSFDCFDQRGCEAGREISKRPIAGQRTLRPKRNNLSIRWSKGSIFLPLLF